MFSGGFAALMGICGLVVASHAGQGVAYYGGLLMAAFCLWFVMYLIKTSGDHG